MNPDLIRLHPFGMSVATDGTRPLLLMKDDSGRYTLPVPLNPLEAGVTLTQSNPSQAPATPHRVTEALLRSLDMKISRCVFREVKSHYQTVELDLENHPRGQKTIRARADEAMSLCLHLEVPIYASAELIQKSRASVADVVDQAQKLARSLRALERNHPYLM